MTLSVITSSQTKNRNSLSYAKIIYLEANGLYCRKLSLNVRSIHPSRNLLHSLSQSMFAESAHSVLKASTSFCNAQCNLCGWGLRQLVPH